MKNMGKIAILMIGAALGLIVDGRALQGPGRNITQGRHKMDIVFAERLRTANSKDAQGDILQKESYSQGGDYRLDSGSAAQRAVGQAFDGHPQERG